MSETEILNKLNAIEKAQRRNGAATQAAIGFAITVFGVNSISTDAPNIKVVGPILALMGLIWFVRNGVQWLKLGK